MLRELLHALADALIEGDLVGHLRAWFQVATKSVRTD